MAKRVRTLQKRLERLHTASLGHEPTEEEKTVAKQLREALRQEEILLKQRSRVSWLREGDRNTGYFQAQAAQRKRINRITSLETANGQICSEPGEIKEEIMNFYQAIYQTQGYAPMDELLSHVQPRVSEAMNQTLEKDFVAAEVKATLFEMAPSKAPGVDGFTAGFCQRHWDVVGEDITTAILGFLNGGELPSGLNDTAITLITKVRNPQKITQYRPIALCPVLYKIAVKVAANMACLILDEVIGEEQSAFVPGRLITDNILVAYESIHAIRRRKKGKNV